jgi:RimJ/RimL family protein N-acetyltransferase
LKVAAREFRTRDGRAYTIASARPNEAGSLLDHVLRVHRTDPDADLPAEGELWSSADLLSQQIRRLTAAANGLYLMATHARDPIGALLMRGGEYLRLAHTTELGMSVRREWRRHGVGRALVEVAIDACRASGDLRRITLRVFESNDAALALYESLGFVVEGRQKRQVRLKGRYLDLIHMSLDL